MRFSKYKNPVTAGSKIPVFIDGVRTPFVKSFGEFEDCDTLELFSRVVSALLQRHAFDANELDEISAGVVVPQTKNPNVARDTIINLGLPSHIHGFTLNRACTSSLHTIAAAAQSIAYGQSNLILAGGVECLSDVPIVYSEEARKFLIKMSRAKTATEKLNILTHFSAKAWLPKVPAVAEPLTGLTMGEHAEIMAKKNHISRADQDAFAAASHRKAAAALEKQYFADELIPIWPGPSYKKCVRTDNIIRGDSNVEALAALKPAFDKKYGTISAGNSSPLTDGAAITLIADSKRAEALGLKPKAVIRDMYFVGVDPMDQLLIGPAVAIPLLLKRNKMQITDIDLFEIHEAFAAQVLCCLRSMESPEFNERYFGEAKAFGTIPEERLNVNGGAIAIGHPFGATGARLLTTLISELGRRKKSLGVIGICAAGGMAGAMLIERLG